MLSANQDKEFVPYTYPIFNRELVPSKQKEKVTTHTVNVRKLTCTNGSQFPSSHEFMFSDDMPNDIIIYQSI